MYRLRDSCFLYRMKYRESIEARFGSLSGHSGNDNEKESHQIMERCVGNGKCLAVGWVWGEQEVKKGNVLFWATENILELFTMTQNISWKVHLGEM